MRQTILRTAALFLLVAACADAASAQSSSSTPNSEQPQAAATRAGATTEAKVQGGLFALDEMQRQLREQCEEIEELRAALKEQSRLVGDLRSRVEQTERQVAAQQSAPAAIREAAYTSAPGGAKDAAPSDGSKGAALSDGSVAAGGAQQDSKLEARVARVEEQSKKTSEAVAKQLGSLTFGGDLRLRYESFYGQQNALASSDNPSALGNPLTTRQRLRMRFRFSVKGKINDEFDWGLRLATGSFADMISTNQTLTDFFNRKPFSVDQAYLNYKPKALPGFQLQAGKFPTPWTFTELTWDNDISPEGLNESYTRAFKNSSFKSVALVA